MRQTDGELDAFEQYMHGCGLYSIEDMRPGQPPGDRGS